ncbi:hypothetical protein PybrP1_005159, partial [[Pythium] brassicae (nom. inval.)]
GSSDKAVGLVLLLVSVAVYVYYTAWVIVTRFFLPYHYAIAIPAALVTLVFCGAATFVGLVMIRSKGQKKKTA